ncbi:MAG TPA: heavy metal translocating P-type ATPase metal-binding domain-containing protein, partial [Gammaproteobacteria bacterium]|nr:heavy metal translocating P-type ATPase metal-binding domain-containing protein [Gammaproteobacteria bacterium]
MSFDPTLCFHCQAQAKEHSYPIIYDGKTYVTCCPGCQAVVTTLLDLGLGSFYEFRTTPSQKPSETSDEFLSYLTQIETQAKITSNAMGGILSHQSDTLLLVEGIRCAACAWLIEKRLLALKGITQVFVNTTTHIIRIVWDKSQLSLKDIIEALYKIGYKAFPYDMPHTKKLLQKERNNTLKRLGFSGLCMMQVMMFTLALYIGLFQGIEHEYFQFMRWVNLLVTAPVLYFVGKPFYQSAWRGIKSRLLNMDVPIAIALSAAFFASVLNTLTNGQEVYFDSICMFLFFLTLARYLEIQTRFYATFLNLSDKPWEAFATIEKSGKRVVVPIRQLKPGDTVIIKPGETIPTDGIVLEGVGAVSEALLTGEPFPKLKQKGDSLIGGTQNKDGLLVMEVTQTGEKTIYSEILRLLEKAQSEKPPIVSLADAVARYFVGGVLILSALTALYWMMVSP